MNDMWSSYWKQLNPAAGVVIAALGRDIYTDDIPIAR
jgi:hypothetical protein